MGEATLFRYFPSKLDLFLMIYGEEFERVIDECAREEAELVGPRPKDAETYWRACCPATTGSRSSTSSTPTWHSPSSRNPSVGVRRCPGRAVLRHPLVRPAGINPREALEAGAFAEVDIPTVVQNCHALYVHEVLRSHARGLPSADLPDRLRRRLETQLRPLQVLPEGHAGARV